MGVFSKEDQQRIQIAIEDAETHTSGQIRVCIEKSCKENIIKRATKYFQKLGMHKTKLRNGVLIYVATVDRKFAIIGDIDINNAVQENFWNDTKETMLRYFEKGNLIEGIVSGLNIAGDHMKKKFPHQPNGKNELSDNIAFLDGD